MIGRLVWSLVTTVLLLGMEGAGGAETVEFSGRVVDARGEPVEGVEVGTYWLSEEGRWVTRRSVKTDAEGRFAWREALSSRARSLMAFDEEQERGAVVTLDADSAGEPLVLMLEPTTLLTAAFESTGLGHEIEKTWVSFTARPAQIAVAMHMGAPSLSLRLPPGDYALRVGGVDCQRVGKRITLTRDMRAVDLGTTDLEPTVIARYYGKKPPAWTVSDARGVDPDVTLADFEGRWVLLEFWGYW